MESIIKCNSKKPFGGHSTIRIHGSKIDVEKAKSILEEIPGLKELSESKARLVIQESIDTHNLKASILYNGNTVWSKNRIIRNLNRVIQHGVLYNKQKPRFIPIGSMLRMPTIGDTILSKYFYNFLHLCCGSIAHYDIRGWVATYPTVDDLKAFFKKNEYGKRVLDYIPRWKTDVIEIVKAIETLLFPFEKFMESRTR